MATLLPASTQGLGDLGTWRNSRSSSSAVPAKEVVNIQLLEEGLLKGPTGHGHPCVHVARAAASAQLRSDTYSQDVTEPWFAAPETPPRATSPALPPLGPGTWIAVSREACGPQLPGCALHEALW